MTLIGAACGNTSKSRALAAIGTVNFGRLLGSYTYGKPAGRVPPRYGLEGLRLNQASETTKAYVFP